MINRENSGTWRLFIPKKTDEKNDNILYSSKQYIIKQKELKSKEADYEDCP